MDRVDRLIEAIRHVQTMGLSPAEEHKKIRTLIETFRDELLKPPYLSEDE